MFVIGDVHGCFETLKALIQKLPSDADIWFVGDLIDRGPESKSVVEFVINNNYNCVMGNHEYMLIEEYLRIVSLLQSGRESQLQHSSMWYVNGGKQTLESYREDDQFDYDKFKEHVDWMKTLPIVASLPIKNEDGRQPLISHSVAHNVINRTHIPSEKRAYHILFNRTFHNMRDSGYYNIIGHTPLDNGPVIRKIYANIDTACFVGLSSWSKYKTPQNGYLTALHYPSLKVISQENIDEDRTYLPIGY